MMSLVVIGVLACFSYPLTYPFTWIVLTLDGYVLFHRAYPFFPLKDRKVRWMVAPILIVGAGLLFYGVAKRTHAERKWGQVASLAKREKEFLSDYRTLLLVLGDEPYFLYNYAVELYMEGHHEKALLVAKRCRKFWADYDLELLQGELLVKLERYEEAEHHFLHASKMCHVRFVPLYHLYQLYKNTGNKEKARRMGETILNKPVKVESAMINGIKANVHRDFKFMENKE
jgi:tetratricopeptide (TPR) repeat protein